jgi:hypothetical protein
LSISDDEYFGIVRDWYNSFIEFLIWRRDREDRNVTNAEPPNERLRDPPASGPQNNSRPMSTIVIIDPHAPTNINMGMPTGTVRWCYMEVSSVQIWEITEQQEEEGVLPQILPASALQHQAIIEMLWSSIKKLIRANNKWASLP